MCPTNIINCFLIWHLVLFNFKPPSLIFQETFLRHLPSTCKVSPHNMKSSWEIVATGTSEIIEVTFL